MWALFLGDKGIGKAPTSPQLWSLKIDRAQTDYYDILYL